MIYGMRDVISLPIQHSAAPHVVWATRSQPECHKPRKVQLAYIKWLVLNVMCG